LLVFKKYKKKQEESKFTKKEKIRDQFWSPNNILPINIGPQLTQGEGAILKEKNKNKKKT